MVNTVTLIRASRVYVNPLNCDDDILVLKEDIDEIPNHYQAQQEIIIELPDDMVICHSDGIEWDLLIFNKKNLNEYHFVKIINNAVGYKTSGNSFKFLKIVDKVKVNN